MGAESRKTEEKRLSDGQLEKIRELASGIAYGTLTLVFQDGLLIQADRTEKIRLH